MKGSVIANSAPCGASAYGFVSALNEQRQSISRQGGSEFGESHLL